MGATDLLSVDDEEVLEEDFSMPVTALALRVEHLLEDSQCLLARVGAAAARRARSWSDGANAQRLIEHVAGALE